MSTIDTKIKSVLPGRLGISAKTGCSRPKLTLYAFHLHYNLAQGTKHQVNDANHLWIKCQELGKKLDIPKLESLPALITAQNSQLSNINGSILTQQILPFTAIEHQKHLHLRGEVNPLQIHDTYALDLTLRYPEPEVQLADLRGLNTDNCLLPNNINASLGQTLVLFTQPLGDIQNEQAFADACVIALLSTQTCQNLNIKCQFQGKLLGSQIYEYNNDADSPQQQCHILIWLNTNSKTTQLEEIGEYYYPLINLLNYRSKIIYARYQAMWCNQQAREDYSKLENKVIDFNDVKNQPVSSKLDKFSLWLNEIPEISLNYARQLRDLQIHKNTIQTNCKNYRIEFNKINNICIANDDLKFLLIFWELVEDTYVEQINTDLGYLQPSQNLFDQMINTIRGIVEIEQTERDRQIQQLLRDNETAAKERDRHLNKTIGALSFGLIASSMGAGSSRYLIAQNPGKYPTRPPFKDSAWVDFSLSFGVGILFGIPTALIWWKVSPYIQSYSHRRDYYNTAKKKLNTFLNLLEDNNKSNLFTDESRKELLKLIESKPNEVVALSKAIYSWCESKTEIKEALQNPQKTSDTNSDHRGYKQKLINLLTKKAEKITS
ncbi:MAG: hypothetical protein KME60_34755 [Cyanomargarita calcarea GSE-NOS-MK-12-04C]|uniref:Uncharacterized protein n=1 Tax=Cyanomargarita calcarea GSE-NOS-MK-12-04C TaxID=2839659 RepID=A0A951QZW0_9CYAN|nr:hypothetical protein [Cyanomargarita calcarea GSE-NOS-MK-12-04C]